MKRSHLLELDWKVYNCDSVEEKQDKGFTQAAVAVLGETNKRSQRGKPEKSRKRRG